MSDCIFCSIVAGDMPCARVHEDEQCVAFMDIHPLQRGHILVIPRKHYELLTDMPADEASALAAVLPRLARAVVAATGAEGFNILQANGSCAGQVVSHVHFHIIPRRVGDGLGFRWNAGEYREGEMEKYRRGIQEALEDE